ncbi:GNAT family N-acetyltransferase [Streptomyces montanisoli]|uniref:GNAT family N-acetyltransferase n=1 Tax=Streptomyces montanisoli TaxID=2798581 RepID=A0A940MA01_9ACTN|nr:GNAT family N-acetyltransferase [Streptomyces montanisoli]MBP0456626.1 GNAT family N-acetyltransferase [Streptomyces montanisoli]
MERKAPRVLLEPWSEADLGLLRALNAPELMTHLGGPETDEQVLVRHRRYVGMSARSAAEDRMFRVVLVPEESHAPAPSVGLVGFWEHVWQGRGMYESGWGLLAAFQGRGIAAAAARAVAEQARAQRAHRFLHAFPSVTNPGSNAVCRRAGYTLLGECAFEYPPGSMMRCNNWRLDLAASPEERAEWEAMEATETPPAS